MLLKINDYLLPCLNKKLFGVDCPGCGIQRSLVFIMKGEFIEAFKMYPAIYTLILFAFVVVVNFYTKIKISRKFIAILAIVNVIIILSNYIIKLNKLNY